MIKNKKANKKINNLKINKILRRVRVITLFSFLIFFLGVFSLIVFYDSKINSYVIKEEGLNQNFNLFVTVSFLSLIILIIITTLILSSIRKFLTSVSLSNEQISEGLDLLNNVKNDELKELIMTRDIVLTKLIKNKNNLPKI